MDIVDPLNGASGRGERLDDALARAIPAPALPADFAARLRAAVARDAALPRQLQRHALEQEWRAISGHLDAAGRRLGLTAVGYVAGAAALTAAGLLCAMPWIRATFGASGVSALPLAGAAVGLAIALSAGLGRARLDD